MVEANDIYLREQLSDTNDIRLYYHGQMLIIQYSYSLSEVSVSLVDSFSRQVARILTEMPQSILIETIIRQISVSLSESINIVGESITKQVSKVLSEVVIDKLEDSIYVLYRTFLKGRRVRTMRGSFRERVKAYGLVKSPTGKVVEIKASLKYPPFKVVLEGEGLVLNPIKHRLDVFGKVSSRAKLILPIVSKALSKVRYTYTIVYKKSYKLLLELLKDEE